LTVDLDALFNQHRAGLLRYLTRYTADPEEAADAVQEAYLRLLERPPEGNENLRRWLYVVATNVVRDRRKKHHEAVLAEGSEERIGSDHADPLALLEQNERRRAVREVLGKLSTKERTILLMREEGFLHREIAAAVGTTTKSIGTMLVRALNKLAKDLGEEAEELQ
jgi:RNA polymerase sigma-70 factor (ECF subfamily)